MGLNDENTIYADFKRVMSREKLARYSQEHERKIKALFLNFEAVFKAHNRLVQEELPKILNHIDARLKALEPKQPEADPKQHELPLDSKNVES